MEEKKEEIQEHKVEQNIWYFRPWAIVLAILCFGPLGLFPLWFRPKTNIFLKISVSIVVMALTVWMSIQTAKYYNFFAAYYKELAETIGN